VHSFRFLLLAAFFAAFPISGREIVTEDAPSRLTVEVEVPSYQIEPGLNGDRVVTDGFTSSGKSGAPDLPWYGFQIASGTQTPSVSIEPLEWEDVALSQPLAGVPKWTTPKSAEPLKDATLFAAAASLSSSISPNEIYRGMSLRKIALPLGTYNEGSNAVHMLKRFRVHVAFSDARATPDTRTREWLAQAEVKNVQGGQYLTSLPRQASLAKVSRTHFNLGSSYLNISIGDHEVDGFAEDGVYALTYENVRDKAGQTISGVPIQNLRMYAGSKDKPDFRVDTMSGGLPPTLKEIPVQIIDRNLIGTFDAGDSILFFAHGTSVWRALTGVFNLPIRWQFESDPYSFINHYYLDWSGSGDGAAQRLANRSPHGAVDSLSVTPHYLRAEHDEKTGSCDLSNNFDKESGYDWSWYIKDDCYNISNPRPVTLNAAQLRSPAADTLQGNSGDTVCVGVFTYTGTYSNLSAWRNGSQMAVLPNTTFFIFGAWYFAPALSGTRLELDSVQWSGTDRAFKGYTIRYKRNLTWNGNERVVFPGDPGRWIAYKIQAGAGVHCLRVESGVGARWLPVQSIGGNGVFTDSVGDGEDIHYWLYSSARNVDPTSLSLERIHTETGMAQNLLTGNGNPQYLIVAPDALLTQALKLADYRRDSKRLLPLTTSVVRTEDIYREWSGGRRSPIAIRNALRWALKHWGGALKYVLLYGDGHYDYRDILNASRTNPTPNHIPPFSLDDPTGTNPENSDDFYAVLDSGTGWENGRLSVALGRLPVQTAEQAANYLDKIKQYEDPSTAGEWRGRVTLAADDATQHGQPGDVDNIKDHTTQSERLGNEILAKQPGTRTDKIYLFDYPANSNFLKPEAQTDLLNNLNAGTLYLNFFGHGAYNQWADEQLMKTADALSRMRNINKNFMVGVFSCTVGRFELLTDEGMIEQYVKQKDYGAIAGLAATRESYPGPNENLGKAMVSRLFPSEGDDSIPRTVGMAVQNAKNILGFDGGNKQKYTLFGEPVTVIRRPGVKIDSLTTPDTLRSLQCGTIKGRIPGGSGHGFINIRIVGGNIRKVYPYNNEVMKRGPILFERTMEYKDSAFAMDYFLPKEVPFGDSTARIEFFAWDAEKAMETNHAIGHLSIQGLADSSACTVPDDGHGPKISVTGCNLRESGGVNFPDKVRVSLPYCLQIDVSDSLGGVMSGDGPEEGTTVEITGAIDPYHPQPGVDDLYHKSYQLTLQNGQISGTHLLKVTARDGFGNLGSRQMVLVTSSDTALRFVKAFNAPNPVKRAGTTFYFSTTLPQDAGQLGVQGSAPNSERVRFDLRIFNQSGNMVREYRDAKSGEVHWDGTDAWGQSLGNGVYFYQVSAMWDESNGAPAQGLKQSLRNILVLSR
jgi:hypothetical protein